jgi:hypothetical protein
VSSADDPRDVAHVYFIVRRYDLKTVRLVIPENGNIIVGHSHFIKTVEDSTRPSSTPCRR